VSLEFFLSSLTFAYDGIRYILGVKWVYLDGLLGKARDQGMAILRAAVISIFPLYEYIFSAGLAPPHLFKARHCFIEGEHGAFETRLKQRRR
jgi:hypothetical protein